MNASGFFLHAPARRHGALLLATVLLVLALVAAPAAAEPLDGVVSGQVTNGTAGGTSPAGDEAVLLIFGVKQQAQVGERTVPVGPDGRFTFEGVDRDSDRAYFVLVRHQGVNYAHPEPFQLKDQTTRQTDVRVYDTTTSDEAIQIERANLMVMGAQEGLLQVMQMGSLVNTGDRTFVTQNPQDGALARGVRFALPKGAIGVQMQTGFRNEDLIDALGGVQSSSPLQPGRHQFAFSFQLPYTGSSADLTLQVPYTAAAFNIYAPEQGARLESDQLAAQGRAQLGGGDFALYSATNVARGTMLNSQLAGLPWAGGAGLNPNQLALLSLGACVLVLSAGVLLFSLRGSRRTAVPPPARTVEDLEQERLELVVRLARLDERFEAGEITEAQYQTDRERWKSRLVELTRLRAASAGPAVASAP